MENFAQKSVDVVACRVCTGLYIRLQVPRRGARKPAKLHVADRYHLSLRWIRRHRSKNLRRPRDHSHLRYDGKSSLFSSRIREPGTRVRSTGHRRHAPYHVGTTTVADEAASSGSSPRR